MQEDADREWAEKRPRPRPAARPAGARRVEGNGFGFVSPPSVADAMRRPDPEPAGGGPTRGPSRTAGAFHLACAEQGHRPGPTWMCSRRRSSTATSSSAVTSFEANEEQPALVPPTCRCATRASAAEAAAPRARDDAPLPLDQPLSFSRRRSGAMRSNSWVC